MMNFKTVLLFLVLIKSMQSANILGIFPTASISHQVVFHALMKDLAARGHHLTILTTDVIKSLTENSNVTQIDMHFTYKNFREKLNFVEYKNNNKDVSELMEFFFPIMMKLLEDQLELPEVKKLINQSENYSFDVVLVENLMYAPILAFGEIYNCPVIGITSLDAPNFNHETIGNEANPIVHPDLAFPYVNRQLTFSERWIILKNVLNEKFLQIKYFNEVHEEILRKHFPNVTSSINELNKKIDFMMVNAHPALGFIRPILPKTIQLGFMHIEPPKELPSGDLKKFLDNSKNGVIYMSFGSNVQSKDLSPQIQKIFLNVFTELDFNFVWKFEAEKLQGMPSNLLISKWLPQADLLAHPNVKLFITQGGQQSMEEAIDRTIPMIIIPFLGDQEPNAKRMVMKKIGLHLDLEDLTEEKLRNSINEMLKAEYKENIVKLRGLVNDQPMTSREKAVWWTEYVIRHKGTKHLEYHGKDIPLYQRYFLDFAAIAIVFLLILIKFIVSTYRGLFGKNFNDDKKIKMQ